MDKELELAACTPHPVDLTGFNTEANLPYGLTTEHLYHAMMGFVTFLGHINQQLNSKDIQRLESIVMPANFSSMVGEFVGATIPKYCATIVRNQYHNGHPDLIPPNTFPDDSVQYGDEGVEVKGSRRTSGWQGHNPEDCWLMVFVFDSNRPVDTKKGIKPMPFRFRLVAGARLEKDKDWKFAGRRGKSRRTPTASVTKSGRAKIMANWIYKDPELYKRKSEKGKS